MFLLAVTLKNNNTALTNTCVNTRLPLPDKTHASSVVLVQGILLLSSSFVVITVLVFIVVVLGGVWCGGMG